MLKKMYVMTDGFNLIGRVKQKAPFYYGTRAGRSVKSKKFDEYYYEAQYNCIPDKDITNYIQFRFMEEAEDIIEDSIDEVEYEELYKNFQNRLHKRLVRYRQKLLMNQWSYFVTFTYDDKKETAEGFEKRLKIVFNNLAKRNGWRVVGGWENGELGGRVHFHAFVYVPGGQMVGKLVNCSRYSYKRHKMEYYIDNDYFMERFGMSDWIAVTREDLTCGGLVSYLVKYVVKSGRKLFYSRGIPGEVMIDVDTEDVLMSYYQHGFKHVLDAKKLAAQLKLAAMSFLDIDFDTSDLDEDGALEDGDGVIRFGFCESRFYVPTVR